MAWSEAASAPSGRSDSAIGIALWAAVAVYAVARVTQAFPERLPTPLIVASHVLPALGFMLLHGTLVYRVRGVLVFLLCCLLIGNFTENLSIATGFPFGHYHFTAAMGPKLLQVPILLGLAYVGMGYVSWTLGRIMIGGYREPLLGSRVWMVPLVAAFVMVAWDLSMDPIWSNLVHAWEWHDGGPYFGVPVSNFLGWYFTVYLIYQSFALYLRGQASSAAGTSNGVWLSAVAFYGVSAAGNLLVIPPPGLSTVVDRSGTKWQVSAILGVSALVSLFVMGAFAVLAMGRLADRGRE